MDGVYGAATTAGLLAGCDRRCTRAVRRGWIRRAWWRARSCCAARCASGLLDAERASVPGAPRSPAARTLRSEGGWRVPAWLAITTVIGIAASAAKASPRTRCGAPERRRAIVRGPHSGSRAQVQAHPRDRSREPRGDHPPAVEPRVRHRALCRWDEERVLASALRGRRAVDRSGPTARESGLLGHRCWRADRLGAARRAFLPGRGATPRCSSAPRTGARPRRPADRASGRRRRRSRDRAVTSKTFPCWSSIGLGGGPWLSRIPPYAPSYTQIRSADTICSRTRRIL